MTEPRPLWTPIAEAAEILGFSQYQIHLLIDEGRLTAQRVGRGTFVLTSDIYSSGGAPKQLCRQCGQASAEIVAAWGIPS